MQVLIFIIIMILMQGCSRESVEKFTYNLLQNVQERECVRDPSLDCPRRESYEEYHRKLEERYADGPR
jgi:hypothetical protein